MHDMTIRVGPARDGERFLETDHVVWFDEPPSLSTEEQLRGVPEHQRFAAEVDGDVDPHSYPGVYGVRPMLLSVPGDHGTGRLLDVAGLTWVGVHPDHRRKGILTAMLRHHFEQTRREGVHLSALHASEPSIYGRHGYGLASLEHEVTLGRGTTFTAPGLDEAAARVRVRMVTITDPGVTERLRACDLRLAERSPGMIVGEPDFFARMTEETPESLRDKEPRRVLMAQADGEDVGFVIVRRAHHWDNARSAAKVEAYWLHGEPATRLALLRRLVDLDLAGSVKLRGIGVDDPLFSWLDGPRATGAVETYDNLWIRLVDVAAALPLRAYAADCDVVVDLTDAAAPWNQGRWRIEVSSGAAKVTASDADADLAMRVDALGAAYLGWRNLVVLQRAGLVTEHRPGAVAELWHAMRTDLPPLTAVGF